MFLVIKDAVKKDSYKFQKIFKKKMNQILKNPNGFQKNPKEIQSNFKKMVKIDSHYLIPLELHHIALVRLQRS